jgi:hypothetical protein
MERMHYVAHAEALSADQRQLYSLGPHDDAAQFLMAKLAPHRASGPVAALQAKVITFAGSGLTLKAEGGAPIFTAYKLARARAHGCCGCCGRAREAWSHREVRLIPRVCPSR